MGELAQLIKEELDANIYLCYQCKKCTNGCPVAEHFDIAPHQLMRHLQFGQDEVVLNSRTVWLCASCYTCTTRCPQGLDLARIMDVVRIEAQRRKIRPAVPSVLMFYRSALRTIRLFGRMYELGLMGELYARLFLTRSLNFRQLFRYDLPLALKMFMRGKLKPLPRLAKGVGKPKVVTEAPKAKRIAYYPGCSLHSSAIEFGMSIEAVAPKLGLELVEPEGWVCCGTSPAHSTDHFLATVLPMKNLALIQKLGLKEVTVPCAACYSRFKCAIYDVQHDPQLRERVLKETGYANGTIEVQHLLETLVRKVGTDKIAAQVVNPLQGLRVVSYYGCLITRPPQVTQAEHYEYPVLMDRVVEALGATSLHWSYKTYCCGGSLSLSELPLALEMSRRILEEAHAVGAEAIVVACPLCHTNLDTRQEQIGLPYRIPIIYITELMGVAFGLPAKELGLDRHLVDATAVLKEKGLLKK